MAKYDYTGILRARCRHEHFPSGFDVERDDFDCEISRREDGAISALLHGELPAIIAHCTEISKALADQTIEEWFLSIEKSELVVVAG